MDNTQFLKSPAIQEVVFAFRQWLPRVQLLWVANSDTTTAYVASNDLARRVTAKLRFEQLPSVGLADPDNRRIIFICAVGSLVRITDARREMYLKKLECTRHELLFVNAYQSRAKLTQSMPEFPWGTIAWFADEPDHFISIGPDALIDLG